MNSQPGIHVCGKANPVLVVGSIAYDSIITPHLSGERILGGSASYASIAASYFGPVNLVAVVGHDFEPAHEARLARLGVNLEGLQRDHTGPTFAWAVRYTENFDRRETIRTQLNVFSRFKPKLPLGYRSSRYILLGNIQPQLQAHVLDQLAEKAFVIADTIDLWINTERNAFEKLLERTDGLVINDSEARLITGRTNLIEAGHRLLAMGPKFAVVKKGEHGALLFHPDGLFAVPAYPVVEINDPTGAGDSFAGAFIGYVAATGRTDFPSIKRALIHATAAASLTVQAFGCDALEKAGRKEILSRVAKIEAMITIDRVAPVINL